MKISRVKHWFAHRIDPKSKHPVSLFGGLAALYPFGWDITAWLFTVVYANFNGKRTLHIESRDGSGTVLLWANAQMRGEGK